MPKPSPQFLVYYRVSTKTQGESGLGLEAQRAYILHFLPADAIAGEVTEVESAKSITGRPILRAAIERCRKEGLTLAVAKIDRLSRRTEDALQIFADLNGRLWTADVPNLDKFTLTLFMAIADRERELIGIRTSQALQAKKRSQGSVHPIKGHRTNFTDQARTKGLTVRRAGTLAKHGQVLNYVSVLRAKGDSFAKIATQLNADGYRTTRGCTFTPTAVQRLTASHGG